MVKIEAAIAFLFGPPERALGIAKKSGSHEKVTEQRGFVTYKGKLSLSAQVYLNAEELANASVYIHLKGYSRATVTHLDIEHPELNSIIPPKTKTFTWIAGIENGILIITEKGDKVKIIHPLLTKVLQSGEKTRTLVGGKFGGIFIGFRKGEISKLEEIADHMRNFSFIVYKV